MHDTLELFVSTVITNPELGVFYSLVTVLNLMLFRMVGMTLMRMAGYEVGPKKEPDPVFEPLIKRITESHPDHWKYQEGYFKSTTQSGLMFTPNRSSSRSMSSSSIRCLGTLAAPLAVTSVVSLSSPARARCRI